MNVSAFSWQMRVLPFSFSLLQKEPLPLLLPMTLTVSTSNPTPATVQLKGDTDSKKHWLRAWGLQWSLNIAIEARIASYCRSLSQLFSVASCTALYRLNLYYCKWTVQTRDLWCDTMSIYGHWWNIILWNIYIWDWNAFQPTGLFAQFDSIHFTCIT